MFSRLFRRRNTFRRHLQGTNFKFVFTGVSFICQIKDGDPFIISPFKGEIKEDKIEKDKIEKDKIGVILDLFIIMMFIIIISSVFSFLMISIIIIKEMKES